MKPIKSKFLLTQILAVCFIVFSLGLSPGADAQSSIAYQELKGSWNSIFPNGNRNAGGSAFFRYIYDNYSDYKEFLDLNTAFCPVSGSLVHPSRGKLLISLKESGSTNKICGFFYPCCWPCACDLMKYAETAKVPLSFEGGERFVQAILINNPCSNDDFPSEVDRKLICEGENLNSKTTYSFRNKLIVGILHNPSACSSQLEGQIALHPITGERCKRRNNLPIKDIQGGMGDIFIRLAK